MYDTLVSILTSFSYLNISILIETTELQQVSLRRHAGYSKLVNIELGKGKAALKPNWPTLPELIPVSVA